MKEQNLYFDGATRLTCTPLGNIAKGQDGVIYDGCLFRFDSKGNCHVYEKQTLSEVSTFTLDKADLLTPHSNSVSLRGDILYTNLYNTYAKETDRNEGVCCAYRITREGDTFHSKLVQVIRIGFADTSLWQSENRQDVRPYGNFVVEKDTLHAFVMRDESHCTRFFRFPLPDITAGAPGRWGVPIVTLTPEDIETQFDECYVNYMQGAICVEGLIYSTEGFNHPNDRGRPALRIFDTNRQKQVFYADLVEYGLLSEPEWIDYYGDCLYYADHAGNVYRLGFTGDT